MLVFTSLFTYSALQFITFARERFLVYKRTKADLYDGPDPKGHLQNLGLRA